MTRLAHRPTTAVLLALGLIAAAAPLAYGATYGARVRWSPSSGSGIAGYRVTVRPLSGASLPVVDAGLPAPGSDGALATQVSGLDGRTDYEVTVVAYTGAGQQSAPSNAIGIGYAQVASRIDTDGDGLTDAAEDPNLNRAVDAGESSALSGDSDGDGVGDAPDQCEGTAAGATVNAAGCSCAQVSCAPGGVQTIWPSDAVPTRADLGPEDPVELGVKFRSDVAGYITGIRFYKHALNTGTHVGNLWSSSGTRLATATFSGESASGWQQVTFAQPVAITAGTVYVASYFCPNGHFSADVNYFLNSSVDRPPLHALANGVSGPNGVYAYGSASRFPTDTWSAANYWVDVAFSATTATLTSLAVSPASQTLAVGATRQLAATGTYSDGTIQTLTTQAAWTSTSPAVASVSAGGLVTALAAGSTTIRATVGTVSGTTTVTVSAVPEALAITTASLPGGTVGTPYAATLAATGGTPPYAWSVTSGLPAGLALDASSGAISGTPTAAGTSSVAVQAGAGSATASRTLTITIAPAAGGTFSIWPPSAVPGRPDDGPDRAVELGVKFRSDVAGTITGLRFYKHALNTGTHVGNLWSSTGTLLATATFADETASGWQVVSFAQPVPIAANTVYVASYFCPAGHYSADISYFANGGVDRAPLHALANGVSGPNGVYTYRSTSRFPTSGWASANYWVDVVFRPTTALSPPALAAGCTAAAQCDDGNPCTTDICAAGGACVNTPRPNGAACDPADACSTGDTCVAGMCAPAPPDAADRRRGMRVALDRLPGGYALTAKGRFAVPEGFDLGSSGLSLVLEDGTSRPLLTVDVPGSDFTTRRGGWEVREGATELERLEVRAQGGQARVKLAGALPGFDLLGDLEAAGGVLRWRITFGPVCTPPVTFACTDGTSGRRRCRR